MMLKGSELSKKNDRELVELLIDSSQPAFNELYARYKNRLMYICKRYLKSEAESEDLVHDIFLRIWETRHFLNPELTFSGYLKTITQNCATDKLRHFEVHSRFAKNVLMNMTDSVNETEDTIIDNDYAKFLNELVDCLPARQKEIFRLSRMEGLTYNEISEMLEISVPAIQKHASLALMKIKEQLIRHADIHFL